MPFYPWESVGHGGHSRSDTKRWATGTHRTNVQQVNTLLKSKMASFTGLQKQFSDDYLVFSCSFLPSFSAWWLKAEYNIDVAVYSFQGSNSRSSSVKGREITFNERISSHCFQKKNMLWSPCWTLLWCCPVACGAVCLKLYHTYSSLRNVGRHTHVPHGRLFGVRVMVCTTGTINAQQIPDWACRACQSVRFTMSMREREEQGQCRGFYSKIISQVGSIFKHYDVLEYLSIPQDGCDNCGDGTRRVEKVTELLIWGSGSGPWRPQTSESKLTVPHAPPPSPLHGYRGRPTVLW